MYPPNGVLLTMRLPMGRELTYGFDGVGWPRSVGDAARQDVTDAGYTDHGPMGTPRINGQILRERRSYDELRLQLTGIALEPCLDNSVACGTVGALRTLGYGYGPAGAGNGGGDAGLWLCRTEPVDDVCGGEYAGDKLLRRT